MFSPNAYSVEASAKCALVFPAPNMGVVVAAGSSARYAFVVNRSCTDDVMSETRLAFKQLGWAEVTAETPGQRKYVAMRNDAQVEVDISDAEDVDKRQMCRWELESDAVALRGTHEIGTLAIR